MDTHWENAIEWDRSTEEVEDEKPGNSASPPGSFHCKAALRCHESNLKLFLYRKSYMYMRSISGSIPYTEESLLLLPDLWNCFYHKTHGLDRIFDTSKARSHSAGSSAFSRWADFTITPVLDGYMLSDTLMQEAHIWQCIPDWIRSLNTTIFPTIINKFRYVLYLVYFVNLSLIALNHRDNPSRPDIDVILPGIITKEDDATYKIMYNEYLVVYVHGECVRVITPIFDQILQKDIYLNLCDKLNERMNVVLGSHLITYAACHQPNDDDNYDIHLNRAVHQILKWGDDLLYRHRNNAYMLIGKYEAYCVSSIIKRDDPKVWKNDEFQHNLLADDLENQVELHGSALELCRLLDGMHEAVLAEVHGLWRIWGHPIIDLEGGLLKMEATCTKQHNISERETRIGERTFKLTFCKNYFQKHGHYPLTNMTDNITFDGYSDHLKDRDKEEYKEDRNLYSEDSYVHRCLNRNSHMNERNSEYDHSDWDSVVLYQSFQIPQSINLATMIKDKAISQTRQELVESVMSRNSVFDPKKRRGVLKWLNEQTIRLKDYLLKIDERGLDEDDRIIGLYPKERELKPKARFFSLMSYNMRMYITATEEILGKYLLPYFPMITMSDTLLNMIIRLFNMTTSIGASGSKVTYSMNIDFSKWNQNMREATNAGIFHSIDRVIGFRRLISRTHDIFRNSYLYLCSGEYIPVIIRRMLTTISPYSRIGDESGKEGLRQKGWTITTVCDILSLAFMHNVRIELIGGGDNQVLTIEIQSQGKNLLLPEGDQLVKIQERMNRFRNALAKKMEKRGLPLKLEETWISHRLLMYNKIMYLSGVPLPGRLKVISRMFSNSNEGILTLGNITSTLGTGFQALSSKDYDPILPWVISRLMTLISLGQYYLANPVCGTRRLDQQVIRTKNNIKNGTTHFGTKDEYWRAKKQTITRASYDSSISFQELFLICLYHHKVLGGPGIGTPLSYIMKGFPDPASEALAFNYSVIKRLRPGAIRNIITNITAVKGAEIMHWEHLLEDPVSINHDAPAHGVAALREQAEAILKKAEIKNVKFKELISLGNTEYLRSLSEQLCQPNEIEPRLLHDIVGSTIPGYVNTILSKVDQSSTLSKLAVTSDVITSVYTSEMDYYMYLADKVHTLSGHTIGECPTEDARALRNSTWKRTIIGVTTPHPMAFLKSVEHNDHFPQCDQNYISVLVKRSCSRYKIKRGDFRPYFGSYTQEKFKSGVLSSAYGDEDILKRSLKIQKLLGWRFKVGSVMYNIIQSILRCVTDSDPNKFLPTPEEITGDVEHRYHDMATKHGGIPSNLIKYYTHASCNTTTFIDHSKGAANESLHFQAAIIYSCMIAILQTHDSPIVTKVFHFHESCPNCIKPIVLSSNDGDSMSDVKLVSCPDNELMYIEEKDIPVHYHNYIAFVKSQVKRASTIRGDNPPIQFNSPTERTSWLVLVCASFLDTNSKMKKSALKLIVSELTAQENIYIIKSMAVVTTLSEGVPWGKIDASAYTDLYQKYKGVLDTMLQSTSLSDYIFDLGIIPTDDPTRVGGFLMNLHEIPSDYLDEDTQNAAAKYQDPEFYYSKLLICARMNPSLKTCPVCSDNLKKRIRDYSNPLCGIHGELKVEMKYHLYSLDKLSRYKGTSTHHALLINPPRGEKRKRRTIFECITSAVDSSMSRSSKRRKEGFMFRKSQEESSITSLINVPWLSQQITIEGMDTSDRLAPGVGMRAQLHGEQSVPNHVAEVLALAMSLLHILINLRSHHPNKQSVVEKEQERELHIALEVVPDSKHCILVAKSLSLLDAALRDHLGCSVRIHLVCSHVTSLEDVELRYLRMLMISYKSLVNPDLTRIKFGRTDDACLDIFGTTEGKDAIIIRNPQSAEYINEDFYLISNSYDIYEHISRIDEININRTINFGLDLLIPTSAFSSPFPIMAHAVRKKCYNQASDALVVSCLSDYVPEWKEEASSRIICDLGYVGGQSIYNDLYHSLVSIRSGITSRSSYDAVMSKLAGGLYNFALKASQQDQMPWRCTAIIRLMLCIKILTDKDGHGALEYYAACNSVSYKRGTYKIIQLHQGRRRNRENRNMINWTPGSFGRYIVDAVDDVKQWLFISWNHEHSRLPYIVL